jgi:hypothetical protein
MVSIQRSQPDAVEAALVDGDLSRLTVQERIVYYTRTCESLGLNPLTKPFAYLKLNGRLVLYPLRDCTDQLRKLNRVSITIASRETVGDCYIVTARASMPDGRCDESTGVVPLTGLKGEALANAFMKGETKAKRRATLSICGLGMVDDSEIDSIPGAQRVAVEVAHAELPPPADAHALAAELDSVADAAALEVAKAKARAAWKGLGAEERKGITRLMSEAQARVDAACDESAGEGSCGDDGATDA